MSALIDNSLVVAGEDASGLPRFSLLETIREFAGRKLRERGEAEDAERRHGAFYVAFTRRFNAGVRTAAQATWIRLAEPERGNVTATFERATERGDPTTAVGLMIMWILGSLGGALPGSVAYLEALHNQEPPLPDDLRALLLFTVGGGRILAPGGGDAVGPLTEAAALRRQLGIATGEADAEGVLGFSLLPDPSAATHLERALDLYRQRDDLWGQVSTLLSLGTLALIAGDTERAEHLNREALTIAQPISSPYLTATILDALGFTALAAGNHEAARSAFLKAGRLLLDNNTPVELAETLLGFAAVSLAAGDPSYSAQLLGTSDATRHQTGWATSNAPAEVPTAISTGAREMLGDDAYDQACAEGAGTRTCDAVERALNRLDPAAPRTEKRGHVPFRHDNADRQDRVLVRRR